MEHSQRKKPVSPPSGWLRSELAALLRVSPPTIAKYIREGLLPRAEFRGAATRYQRIHVLRLLAIRHLRADGVVEIKQIKTVLARLTTEQLEAWVLSRPNSPETLRLLGVNHSARNAPALPGGPATRAESALAQRNSLAPIPNSPAMGWVLDEAAPGSPNAGALTVYGVDQLPAPPGPLGSGRAAPSGAATSAVMTSTQVAQPLQRGSVVTSTWEQLEVSPGIFLSWRSENGAAARSVIQRLFGPQ